MRGNESPALPARRGLWTRARSAVTTALAETREELPARAPTGPEKGWSGVVIQDGQIDDEHNARLAHHAWRGDASTIGEGKRIYRESAAIRASVNSLINPLLVNGWRCEPANPDDPDCQAIAACATAMLPGSPSWPRTLRDALLMVRDGVRLQEQVVRFDATAEARAWEQVGETAPRWVEADGVFRRGLFVFDLKPRLPHTVDEWLTDPRGNFAGVKQTDRDDGTANKDAPVIPAARLLRFTYGEEGNNWNGEALIRPAWGLAALEKDILIRMGIALNRFAFGTPRAKQTEPTLDNDAWTRALEVVRDWQHHQKGYLLQVKGIEFDILEAKLDSGKLWIQLLDWLHRSIHRLCGTMHNFTGEGAGARSLFDAQFSAFLLNLGHLERLVCEPYNDLLRNWTRWNGWPESKAPRLVSDDLTARTPGEMAEAAKAGAEAGIFAGRPQDEQQFRRVAGWTPISEEELDADEGEIVDIGSGPGSDGAAQDTALNGAQVTSAREIILDASSGALGKDQAAAMLRRFFNVSGDDAEAMLSGAGEGAPTPPPEDAPPSDSEPGSPLSPGDGPGAGALSGCDCGGAHALALPKPMGRPFPSKAECIRFAAQIGPFHALAESYFSAASSRIGRDDKLETAAEQVRRNVRRIGADLAERLAGLSVGEAAKVKLPASALVGIRQTLKRQYRALLRLAQDEVKREVTEQRKDPDFADKLAEARIEAGEEAQAAFATIAERAGRAPRNEIEQLDIDDFIDGAVRTTSDNIGRKVAETAQATVQTRAIAGGASQTEIIDAINAVFTAKALASTIKPDMQGVYSTGRRVELAREDVPFGLYTVTPELSSQVCDVCLDTAGDPNNPFRIGGETEGDFAVPNPNCMGTLAGSGNPCYCVIIGLTLPPDEDVARDIATGGLEA